MQRRRVGGLTPIRRCLGSDPGRGARRRVGGL